jgi:hypothetical protein
MTRGEVKSLNDLAMAHGGHLTINPHTGLPEAGFLRAMLPMIIGAGLAAATGGTSLAMSPAMIGTVVGAGYGVATGSVKKGLMAGLGAYGGAGMGSSLAASGAQTGANMAGPEALNAGTSGAEAEVARQNALAQQQQQALQAKTPDYLQDYGPKGQFTDASAKLPTSTGGMNVAPPASQYTPSQIAEMKENLANQAGMKISSANPYATPFTTETQTVLANPISTGYNTATSSLQGAKDFVMANKTPLIAAGATALTSGDPKKPEEIQHDSDMGQQYNFQANPTAAATGAVPNPNIPSYEQMMTNPRNFGAEQTYFNPQYVKRAAGGPVEDMSNQAALGTNTMYPMANMRTSAFATPYQTPQSTNMMQSLAPSGGGTVDQMSGEPNMQGTRMATGGISDAHYNLGGYSDGGRLLRGPGDGVSDDIPAVIGQKQPARLADGEFVVPARIVSELGNGSTEAGARKLYAMMDRVQAARKKTVGKDRVAHNSRADKYLPA